jgi:ribonuclease D
MTIRLHRGDLPDLSRYKDSVAIDTETMGLNPHRDRLCVVQLSNGDGSADVVQIPKGPVPTRRTSRRCWPTRRSQDLPLRALRSGGAVTYAFGVMPQPVYCTKIASRLVRTYTDRHGLKDLVREVLNVDLSKQQQIERLGRRDPHRGAARLCRLRRAASARVADAARRHAGARGRADLAAACFEFLPTRARLDLLGWEDEDIFAHS